jgi:NAD(P)-dependent dehydrogenase (short-subunit alcohol dehydrogenase family)
LLASQGAKVIVNDIGGATDGRGSDRSAADRVVLEIKEAGGEAAVSYDSIDTVEGANSAIKCALDRFGGMDILVNNAGILRDKSFAKMDMDDYDRVLRVHLFGSAFCTQAAWPHFIEQKYGRVVMTTSVAGTSGNFGQANYASAKLGLVGLMNALALEGQRNNVLVNAISPAAITRMSEGLVSGKLAEYMKPEHVAPAVGWLCSQACNVTGAIITAGAGGFGRLHYFETEGVQFDPNGSISVEMFSDNFAQIYGLEKVNATRPGPQGYVDERLKRAGFL